MNHGLKELVDIEKLQALTDRLYQTANVPSSIVTMDGEIVTGSGWQRICTDFHRAHPQLENDCRKSDTRPFTPAADHPFCIYTCPRGLTDAFVPIMIAGRQVGKAFVGQVFLAAPGSDGEQAFRKQARQFGLDESAYIDAMREVPVISHETFRAALTFISEMIQMVVDMGIQRMSELKTQRELQQSKDRYQFLVENQTDIIIQVSPEMTIQFASPNFYKVFGADESEFIGKPFVPMVDPADMSAVQSAFSELLAPPHRSQNEYQTMTVNGLRWFSWAAQAVFSAAGELQSIVCVGRDITEQKEVELALRESEERFRSLHNASFGGIGIHDKGVILECNQGLAELTGYSKDELVGMNGLLLIAEQSRARVMEKILSGYEKPYEAIGLRKNGEHYPLRLEAKEVPYKGKLVRTTEFRDITEQKIANEALREAKIFLDSVSDIAYITDTRGNVAWVNSALEKVTGIVPDDVIGKPFLPYFIESDHAVIRDAYARTLQGESHEVTMTFKVGVTCSFNSLPKRNENGEIIGTFGIARDITERIKAERELIESENRFRSLINNINEAVALHEIIMDESGQPVDFVFLDCNPTYENLTHLKRARIIGKRVSEVLPNIEKKWLDLYGNVAISGDPITVVEHSDYLDKYWEVRAYSPKKNQFAAAFTDVTERIQSAEKLRINNRRWKQAQRVAQIGNWEYDIATNQVWGSEEAFRIYGIPLDLDENPNQIIPLEYAEESIPERERTHQALIDLISTGKSFELEYEVIRKDNNRSQHIYSKAELERDDDGNPVKVNGTVQDITERKRRDQALKESEETFKALAEYSIDTIMRFDRDHRHLYVNPVVETQTGIKPKDFIGKTHAELGFPPYLVELWESAIDQVFVSSQRHRIEFALPNGTHLDWWLTPEFSDTGEVAAVITSARDITERKRAEEEILKFRTIADKAVHGSAIVELDGTLVYINEAFASVHGYAAEELIGKNLGIFHAPDQMEAVIRINQELIRNGSYNALEVWHIHKDGTRFPMLMSAVIIYAENGDPLYLTATAIDITERKKVEERYKIINDASLDFIYSFDLDLRFTSANRSLCKIMQRTEDQIIGKTYADLNYPRKQIEELESLYAQVLSSLSHVKQQNVVQSEDGSIRYYETVLNPIFNEQGEVIGVSGSSRDITDKVLVEKAKEKVEGQLRQSQKMESIGRLAGGVAHDFNNLLTTISGNVSLAVMDLSKDDPLYATLREIDKAANSAASLTRQLLAFSRKQIIDPKVFDLNDLIDNTQKMIGRLIGEDIELTIKSKCNLGSVKADPGQVEQILINLAVNARDAMPDGGRLTIETDDIVIGREYCEIHPSFEPGRYIRLAVSDTGHGMDNETSQRIFDPFYTTKGEGKGTGLGLAMVYGIVKQHGGHIEVYSEADLGTTFKVYFPEVSEKAEAVNIRSDFDSIPKGSETILVVEDDAMVRNIAVRILKRQGYRVFEADTGGNALALVQKQKLEPDLLLTDIVMPNMNGRELAEKLLEASPGLKILFTSGYTEDVIAHHGVLDEGLYFIGKPYSPQALAKMVREVLDG